MLILAIPSRTRRSRVIAIAAVVARWSGWQCSTPSDDDRDDGVRELGQAAVSAITSTSSPSGLLPFLAAAEMTRDHPLPASGRACFRYHFMPYPRGPGHEISRPVAARLPHETGGRCITIICRSAAEAGVDRIAVSSSPFLLGSVWPGDRPNGERTPARAVSRERCDDGSLVTAIFIV
jgi:hypothetical protein